MCAQCENNHFTGYLCISFISTSHCLPPLTCVLFACSRYCAHSKCGGKLHDTLIHFGDDLNASILATAERNARAATLVLSLGSSMTVTPACDLLRMAQGPLVICNRQVTDFDLAPKRKHTDDSKTDKKKKRKKDESEDANGVVAVAVRVFGDCDALMQRVMRLVMGGSNALEKWETERLQQSKSWDAQRSIKPDS